MFIHFVFGTLGKRGNTGQQTRKVIELILNPKKLLVSKCTEFIPQFPKHGMKRIPVEKMRFVSDNSGARLSIGLNEVRGLPDDNSIYYSQRDVPMICFIKIAFNKLRTSNHWREYGRFGIVLTDGFLRSKGIRPVKYYTEDSLWGDPLIQKWNYELKGLTPKEKADLEKEILSYRKPATYFRSFKESVIARITAAPSGGTVQYLKYDRYDEGYDFTKEQEYRIVFDEGVDYLCFYESDLLMIITPDLKAKNKVESFLKKNWSKQPTVKVFPS